MILFGLITVITLCVLMAMVAQVRDLTTELHHFKTDMKTIANTEDVHHNEMEVGINRLYQKLEDVGRTYIDLSNKYTLLKRDVATLSKKSVFGYEQNMDEFREQENDRDE